MNKKAHSNPKSLNWVISLVVIIVLSAGVIFGSKLLYDNTSHISSTVATANQSTEESTDVQAGATAAAADTSSSASPVA